LLIAAANDGNVEVIRLLIKKGADGKARDDSTKECVLLHTPKTLGNAIKRKETPS
jgi:hypothetical protein